MKKLICVFVILTLLLCGCGGSKEPEAGVVTPQETAAPEIPRETVQETVPQTEAPAETGHSASLGRMEGGVYTNDYVGFRCTLDSNWAFYTAEELQQLPENINELLEGTEVMEVSGELTQISDMMAENVNDLTTMNVLYTKMGMQERLAYAMLSEKEILEQVLSQKDMLISSYAQAGIQVSDMELVEVTFLGQPRYAIHTTSTANDVPYFTLQIYDYHLGQYGVVTTLASFVEDNTAGLLALFEPVA